VKPGFNEKTGYTGIVKLPTKHWLSMIKVIFPADLK